MPEQQEPHYMTVGELADKVGVTVRTIQYYDQENLLKPSAKGSRNQRLYTEKDEETLYKILCFKFMGLSITEIRESLYGFDETPAVKLLLDKKIADVEKEMSALMKRFAT
ncbi:MAG: MerR family transcriptional regulator, partial [Paludibacteraceae bacterium]|nr:MerR family transcriptional regulator [Paludibacteraceae bacterium]